MPRFDITPADGDTITQTASLSADESSTPFSIDDTSGAAPQTTLTVDRHGKRPADWKRLKNQAVKLTLSDRTVDLGVISHVSGGDGAVSIAVDSIAVRLAVKRHVAPKQDSLRNVLAAWVTACGVPSSALVIQGLRLSALTVAAVGFYDSVWLRIKQLAAAVGFEVVVIANQLVVREYRSVLLAPERVSSTQWDVDDTTMAARISVNYYQPQPIVPGDVTIDYSRQDISDDTTNNAQTDNERITAYNGLPPGYFRRTGIESS